MKKFIIYLFVFFIIVSCGKKTTTNYVEIEKVWVPKKLSLRDPLNNAGIYKDMLYFWIDEGEKAYLNFFKLNGELEKKVTFKRGRGPGEIFSYNRTIIKDDTINIFDNMRRILQVFSMEGEYIDDYKIDVSDFGIIDRSEEFIFFSGVLKEKLIKIGTKKNEIIKSIKYDNEYKSFREMAGKQLRMGPIVIDQKDKKIYRGSYVRPYKIEKYDYDLNKLDTFERKVEGNFKDFVIEPGQGPGGSIMVGNMQVDDKYLYVSFGGGQQTKREDNKVSITGIPSDYFVSVFDKKTGEFISEIKIKKINQLKGVTNLLKVTKDKIYILLVDFENTLDNILTDEMKENQKSDTENQFLKNEIQRAVLILDNPVYSD
ncbi:MAG TPA: hypothetical protein VKN74_06350 [Candidatus Mcinerneyibacterium sp.]|nr:hypothetical protein [Candidatus Mcinerneyibacterium sp.]